MKRTQAYKKTAIFSFGVDLRGMFYVIYKKLLLQNAVTWIDAL
jgi:hypothetical protein